MGRMHPQVGPVVMASVEGTSSDAPSPPDAGLAKPPPRFSHSYPVEAIEQPKPDRTAGGSVKQLVANLLACCISDTQSEFVVLEPYRGTLGRHLIVDTEDCLPIIAGYLEHSLDVLALFRTCKLTDVQLTSAVKALPTQELRAANFVHPDGVSKQIVDAMTDAVKGFPDGQSYSLADAKGSAWLAAHVLPVDCPSFMRYAMDSLDKHWPVQGEKGGKARRNFHDTLQHLFEALARPDVGGIPEFGALKARALGLFQRYCREAAEPLDCAGLLLAARSHAGTDAMDSDAPGRSALLRSMGELVLSDRACDEATKPALAHCVTFAFAYSVPFNAKESALLLDFVERTLADGQLRGKALYCVLDNLLYSSRLARLRSSGLQPHRDRVFDLVRRLLAHQHAACGKLDGHLAARIAITLQDVEVLHVPWLLDELEALAPQDIEHEKRAIVLRMLLDGVVCPSFAAEHRERGLTLAQRWLPQVCSEPVRRETCDGCMEWIDRIRARTYPQPAADFHGRYEDIADQLSRMRLKE